MYPWQRFFHGRGVRYPAGGKRCFHSGYQYGYERYWWKGNASEGHGRCFHADKPATLHWFLPCWCAGICPAALSWQGADQFHFHGECQDGTTLADRKEIWGNVYPASGIWRGSPKGSGWKERNYSEDPAQSTGAWIYKRRYCGRRTGSDSRCQ